MAGLWQELTATPDFFLMAGPCVIESEEKTLFLASELKKITSELAIPFVFKASFDKANRSSGASYRGPGMEEGLRVLAKVRREVGVPVLTDLHETYQVQPVAEVVDILQIPAFLCRQTDLVTAAAATGKPVNIKKGQFMAAWDMKNIVEKARSTGNSRVFLTERGTTFGYNNLVVDMRSLPIMRSFGVPVIFDGTHSVQQPGGLGGRSGGQREFVAPLCRAAVAIGVDGLFLEVHDEPEKALSDGPNMVSLSSLPSLLRDLLAIARAVRGKKDEVSL